MGIRLYAMTCGWLTGELGHLMEGGEGRTRLPIPGPFSRRSDGSQTSRWREMIRTCPCREGARLYCGGELGDRRDSQKILRRDRWFESISLQRRVCKPSVPHERLTILRPAEPAREAVRPLTGARIETSSAPPRNCFP
jgi:hypothetical protein